MSGDGSETEPAALVSLGREAWPGVITAGQPRGHDGEAMVAAAGLRYVHVLLGKGRIADGTFERVRAAMRDRGDAPVVVDRASGNRVGGALIPWWVPDEGLSEEETA